MGDPQAPAPVHRHPASALRRWAPLALVAVVMAVVFSTGVHRYLSFKTIGLNYDLLRAYIGEHLLLSLALFMALYAGVIALSLPVGVVLTIGGGLLFGWKIAVPAIVTAATAGATVVFLIVNTSFGTSLAARAGPFVAKLRDGFRENALSYLLFLRLVPIFPFVVINLVPGLLGVPLRTFVIGTWLGIIPGTTAYALAGSGLGSVIEAQNAAYKACRAARGEGPGLCSYDVDVKQIITPELIYAGIALGLVALIPVGVQIWRKSRAVS